MVKIKLNRVTRFEHIITSQETPSKHVLNIATKILRSGGIIIYHTDTLYGFGVMIHGSHSKSEALKKDGAEITWAHQINNRRIKMGSRELYWQPCLKHIRGANLVIVEQASKLVLNYVLFSGMEEIQ